MNSLIKINSELYKTIISEFSLSRIIVMPLILIGIFGVVDHVDQIALPMFVLITYLWGTYNASKSIPSEINARTWDFQRINAVSPQKMLIAKLFGSTSYNWYGGIICIIFYFITTDDHNPITTVLLLVMMSIFSHAVSILLCLSDLERRRNDKRIGYVFYFIFTLFLTYGITSTFSTRAFYREFSKMFNSFESKEQLLSWYGIEISFDGMLIFIVLFYLTWSIIGLLQLLRKEFLFQNSSLAWILFLVSSIVFNSGFSIKMLNISFIEMFLRQAVTISFVTFYFMMFREKKDAISIRDLLGYFQTKNSKKLWYETPTWLISLVIFLVSSLVYLIVGDSIGESIKEGFNNLSPSFQIDFFSKERIRYTVLALIFFALRDLFVMLYFSMRKTKRSAESIVFFYLIILYIFVPALIGISGSQDALSFFLPVKQNALSIALIAVQGSLMFYLFTNEYKKQTENL